MTITRVQALVIGVAAGIGLLILSLFVFRIPLQQPPNDHLSAYSMSVEERTFEIPYQFTGDQGKITNMTMSFETLTIDVRIEIAKDSTLQIHFPKQMLEQLQVGSGYHYCVGNEFVVFMDDHQVVPEVEHMNDEEILTFPVKAGSSTVHFIGVDMLITPPRCPT